MAKTAKPTDQNGRQTLTPGQVAELFNAAGQPCRLDLILMLERGDRSVGEMAEACHLSPAAIDHHLAMLRAGGMVTHRREGKRVYYSLTATGRALAAFARQLGA